MYPLHRLLRSPDANTEATSSSASEGTTQSSETATTKTDEKEPTTLQEVVEQRFEELTKKEDGETSTTEKADEESPVQELNKTEKEEKAEGEKEETTDSGETKEDDETKEEVVKTDDLDKHPRFKEVIEEKNTWKAKAETFEKAATTHNNLVDYCRTNNISSQQYTEAMELVALINNDPAKALEKLKPIVDGLRGYTGEMLPNDLQGELTAAKQEVEDGTMSQARFDAVEKRIKELAQLRANGARTKITAEQTEQHRRNEAIQSVQQSLQSWEQSKMKSDPDFKPKGKETDADGVYEVFMDKFHIISQTQGINPLNPADMIKVAEAALTQTKQLFSRFTTKKSSIKTLTSTNSSTTAKKQPSSVAEAIQMKAAELGVS